jgi:hypothetical protein
MSFDTVVQEVKTFAGKYWLALVHGVAQADSEVDKEVPTVEALLKQGQVSVAAIFPSIGPKSATILNASLEALGAFQSAADTTAALAPTVQAQLAGLAPTGFSFVLVKADAIADAKSVYANYKTEYAQAKSAVLSVESGGSTPGGGTDTVVELPKDVPVTVTPASPVHAPPAASTPAEDKVEDTTGISSK